MLNIADTLHRWCRRARPLALATVVDVHGSAPLPPGTSVAVDEDGNAVGSISGGCVEGAVYELCRQVLGDRGAPQRARFGYSDDDQNTYGSLDGGPADQAVADQARALLRAGRTGRATIGGDADWCPERLSLLVHVHASRPRLLVFGAVDFAAALSQAGAFLGYRVTVCDARPVFATAARFPHADEVVVDWPHRYLQRTTVDARTAVCVLTHDAKFDIPLLRLALDLPVGYIGAMGSRRTHDERLRLLREAGLSEEQLGRLRSPIGLDLGARTPQETAVSIAAEIIAHTNLATGRPLSQLSGPIHAPAPAGTGLPARFRRTPQRERKFR
ncbi:XdhC/CoxI family protein [Nonomuraea angiospora]|uniref:XdhC family protein n=1 Tax=Nonomuraea angiospora TaxID=46172 RepID=UPI003411DC64